jgi:hypothetical protein
MDNIEIGHLQYDDYKDLLTAMKASYPGWQGNYWSLESIKRLIDKFPEGQIVIKADGKVVGCILSLVVDFYIVH